MSNQEKLDDLTETFRVLGADDPNSWAISEVEQGIPQLAMYVFLKRSLGLFSADSLDRWLQSVAHHHGHEHDSAKQSLSRIAHQGVQREDIRTLLKAFGREMLMEMCCLLDNTSATHFEDYELNRRVADVNWRLYAVDDNGNPRSPMEGLHEIVNDVADQSESGSEHEKSS